MATLTLRPSSEGNSTNISTVYPALLTTHYDKVDEAVADDNSTVVQTESTAYERDFYTLPNHTTTEYGVINNVKIYFRGMTTSNITGFITPALRTNSNNYSGSEEPFASNSTWETFNQTWTTNPNTSNVWTWDEIDELEIGISIKGARKLLTYCTQIYAEVDYTEQWTGKINNIENPNKIGAISATNIASINGVEHN